MKNEKIVGLEPDEKEKVHYLLILDKSGSMQSLKETTVKGFNEIVQTIKEASEKNGQIAHITFVEFNQSVRFVCEDATITSLKEMKMDDYHPSGSTALLDATFDGITKLKSFAKDSENALVTIFTDGEENASKRKSGEIAKLIKEIKERSWIVTYIGPEGIDLEKVKEYGIETGNIMTRGLTLDADQTSYSVMTSSIGSYSSNVKLKRVSGQQLETQLFSADGLVTEIDKTGKLKKEKDSK